MINDEWLMTSDEWGAKLSFVFGDDSNTFAPSETKDLCFWNCYKFYLAKVFPWLSFLLFNLDKDSCKNL